MTDTTSTPDSGADAGSPPPALDPAAPDPAAPAIGRVRDRQRRLLWLAVAIALLAVAGVAAWLVNMVTTARTLQAVTSGVTLPVAAVPTPVPAPLPTPAPVAVPAAPTPALPAVPAGPAVPPVAAPPASNVALAAVDTPRPAADSEALQREPGVRKPTSKKARAEARRHTRATARATGTFARCPALGREGAVICRWHICNGGAGKEAACRPYLERRP